MFRSDQAASLSQIHLGLPIDNTSRSQHLPNTSFGHDGTVYPNGGRPSTSTASHASTSTARDEQPETNSEVDESREEPDRPHKQEPEDAPDNVVKKGAMTEAVVPHASGAAVAPIANDLGGHGVVGRPQDLGIEDKHRFFDPHIKGPRRQLYKKLLIIFGLLTIWLWGCLSIFWGSVYKLTTGLPAINVYFVTFDNDANALLNQPITEQANYLANLPASMPHLGWQVRQASDYPNGLEDVRQEVLHQKSWATVVVNANATSAWRNAIRNGDANYDPNGAIGIYYMGARFYQVQYLYTEALIKEELMEPLTTARRNALQAFNTYAANNNGAIANAAAAPQTLGTAVGYTVFDLRPIQDWAWSGAAPMEASLIYFVIFSFIITFVGGQVRMKTGIEQKLTFGAKLLLRFGWPLIAWFFLSLYQTLVERAFQVALQDYLGRAGFVTLWALNYVTIIGAGLALETMLSILGVPFLPVFLILWIILNITSSFYPLDMLPGFYKFLRWTPFLHNVEGFKIIAYGTNAVQRLGYHFGILFGLIGVELICFPLAMVFERWKNDKGQKKEMREKKEKEEKGQREEA